MKLDPASAALHLNLGVLLEQSGRFDEAIAAYRRSIELAPNDPEAYNYIGNANRKLGRLEESAKWHRLSIKKRPTEDAYRNGPHGVRSSWGQQVLMGSVLMGSAPYIGFH